MASFKSVLSGIGHFLIKYIFSPQAIAIEASVADIALPGFIPLINAAATAIIGAETAAIAAGKQSGSGEQKAAMVISQIEQVYTTFATANGIPVIPANIKLFVDAVVAALNSFPAPTNANSATPTAS
jgi:hypothetical protein